MSFAWPMALLGLGLVALAVVAYAVAQRRRRRYVVRFTNLALLENVADSPAGGGTSRPLAARADRARDRDRPAAGRRRRGARGHGDPHHGQLGVDVGDGRGPRPNDSGARAASSFVKDLPDDFRVGVVSFSDQADIVVPTDDRAGAARAEYARGRQRHCPRRCDRPLGRSRCHEPRPGARGCECRRLPSPSCSSSPTGRRPATTSRSRRRRRRSTRRCRCTVALGTDEGTVQGPDGYGGMRTIRVPPTPRRCHRWPR